MSRAAIEIQAGTAAPVVADYSTIEPIRCPAAGPAARSPTCPMLRPASTASRSRLTPAPTTIASTPSITTSWSAPPRGHRAGRRAGAGGDGPRRDDPPGVRHRAVGRMTILNVVVPPFDPADEWFD